MDVFLPIDGKRIVYLVVAWLCVCLSEMFTWWPFTQAFALARVTFQDSARNKKASYKWECQ